MNRWIAPVIAVALTAPTAALAQEAPAPAYAAFDAFLTDFRVEHHIPAMTAVIVRDGVVVWAKPYGWSDDEGETATTIDTTFSIASVTKPIAATAILAEAAAGGLDLSTPMTADADWADTCEWLSGSPIPFGSGGPQADGSTIAGMDCSRAVTLDDILRMRVNGDGSSFVYNPISYARIDRVIEGAGGRPLRTIVRERVMDPAGIHDIALGWRDPQGGSALRLLALPFKVTEAGELERIAVSDDDFRAAGGIKASASQLAQFDIALDSGRLIPAGWHERIFGTPVAEGTGDYRYGWFAQRWQGHDLFWHSGWDPDRYSAMYLKVPDQGLTLIVLANTEGLWWDNSLVRAEIDKSPIVAAFLAGFVE
ncbi:serine hydrolase domain-containing protein [uncultured Brevundimonas sp.]|uniref:serine hydrolase domain-containing protein n=1 Tax=uncultured Brevundimonas sp. TaxID=213418 RepID=UPI0030EDD48C|tara:strand:+ start:996 stop:2093 length:1098 start_codon:yes stop_codon:yes gene_type:complete